MFSLMLKEMLIFIAYTGILYLNLYILEAPSQLHIAES